MAEAAERTFKLVGGRLCLDFVNTVGNWLDPTQRRDHLAGYGDLVAWARQAGAIGDAEAAALLQTAAEQPAAAAAALARARALREAVHDVAAAIGRGVAPEAGAIERLNGFVAKELAASRLVPAAGGLALERAGDRAAPDRLLWPVVRSAVELFTSGEVGRVRQCADEACGWVFVDASRGGRRRWCDMADCGNQAKVRRFRARHADRTARR